LSAFAITSVAEEMVTKLVVAKKPDKANVQRMRIFFERILFICVAFDLALICEMLRWCSLQGSKMLVLK